MIKFRIDRSISRNGYNLWIINYNGDESFIADPIELKFTKCLDGWEFPAPTLQVGEQIGTEFLRAIAEGMADSGLPIAKFPDSTLKAKDENLKDLRNIIEKILK